MTVIRNSVSQVNEYEIRTRNFYGQLGFVIRSGRGVLNLPKREHSVDDFSKRDVISVLQEMAFGRCDEELTPIGVWARVCLSVERPIRTFSEQENSIWSKRVSTHHGDDSGSRMLLLKVLHLDRH
jgi:hypothetical protein